MHYEYFKTDLTKKIVSTLAEKATTIKKSVEGFQVKVFQWKALGIQCGACFSTIPNSINLHRGVLLMTSYLPELMKKEPPELMIQSKDYSPPSPCTTQNSKGSSTNHKYVFQRGTYED